MLVGKFNRTHSYEKVTQTYVTLVTMKKMGLIGSEISKKRKNSTKHRPSYLWGGGERVVNNNFDCRKVWSPSNRSFTTWKMRTPVGRALILLASIMSMNNDHNPSGH